MDYWEECIKEALEDAGLTATGKQIDIIVSWVEGAHDNYSLATGEEVASKNHISDEARELASLKQEIERSEEWKLSTQPCRGCNTTGTVLDVWGRDMTCPNCEGEGRHR